VGNGVCSVATPLLRVALPRLVEPVANETLPVGSDPVTVAFNVIWAFKFPEAGEACKAVALPACPIVTLVALEVLPALLLSPT
jgi:hypothetical protein